LNSILIIQKKERDCGVVGKIFLNCSHSPHLLYDTILIVNGVSYTTHHLYGERVKMQIVVHGNQSILLLLKEQEKNVQYKRSEYLIHEITEDGRLLLLNTISGEMVLLTEEEKNAFEKMPSNIIPSLSDLFLHGYIVPAARNEMRQIEQLRAIFLKMSENEGVINHYNILPTTCCNARCFYCYESGIKRVDMSKETADSLVKFIAAHSNNAKITLSWFGGEPTLKKDRIDQICRKLNDNDISFVSKMISNAYLFDKELVKHAKSAWHLKNIQITLDGTETIYNKTKAYIYKDTNPYQRVLRNIRLLLDEKIRVVIRLNMDSHNQNDMICLIEELATMFAGEKLLFVYVRRLIENVGDHPLDHSEEEISKLNQRYSELQDLLEQKGWAQIEKSLPSLSEWICMADNPASVQCSPDGILSKCEHHIFDHTIGTLEDGVTDFEEVKRWQEKTPFSTCEGCVLFPSCRYVLKKCPSRPAECDQEEKRKRIDRIHAQMAEMYQKWNAAQ